MVKVVINLYHDCTPFEEPFIVISLRHITSFGKKLMVIMAKSGQRFRLLHSGKPQKHV